MSPLVPSLMRLLQPPYGWILLLVLAMPFWVLFMGVFFQGFDENDHGSLFRLQKGKLKPIRAERELVNYASMMTAAWLLIISFKVYQQYFTNQPVAHSGLGVLDLGLGLFSLASWLGLLLLRAQERL